MTRTIASRENRASLPSSQTKLLLICLRKRNVVRPNPITKPASRPRSGLIESRVVKLDHERLPHDAEFKGYEEVIVQDIDFRMENITFRKEKYYSPGNRRTYLAELPAGYHGQFGPAVSAWVLALSYAGGMSEPKLLELLHTVGMQISAGQLSDLLIQDQEQFHAERAALVRAGLSSSRGPHLDSTGTRVNGRNQHCHVRGLPLSTAYCTFPTQDRLSLLRVLLGGAEPSFRLNEEALNLLKQLGLAHKWRQKLVRLLPREQEWKESRLDEWLDEHLPTLGTKPGKLLKDSFAIAAYHTQTTCPVVELLVCDDAPQFRWLTAQVALCWVHEDRHYKKLTPCLANPRQRLDQFQEHFWKLYRQLLAYQQHPTPKEADALRAEDDAALRRVE